MEYIIFIIRHDPVAPCILGMVGMVHPAFRQFEGGYAPAAPAGLHG